MEVISLPRRGGKTTEIIKRCSEFGGYIVTFNHQACRNIAKQAEDMKVKIPMPITFHEFINNQYHPPGVKQFHIDNLDLCIQGFSRVPVRSFSINYADVPRGTKEV